MLSSCLPALFPPSPPAPMSTLSTSSVELLILGAGWTSTFLLPHLATAHPSLSYAATTRDGRQGSIKWAFNPDLEGPEQFAALPRARTVLVTFPIRGEGGSRRLVEGYEEAVGGRVRWIQLGSTGIWDGRPSSSLPPCPPQRWTDRHSAYDTTNARAVAEDELLAMHEETFVLCLAGLWGGTRDPANWISKVAPTFEALEAKGSVHLVHGEDVARAILAVHFSPARCTSAPPDEKEDGGEGEKGRRRRGERYLVTDLRVYDWWDIVAAHPPSSPSSSTVSSRPPAVPSPSPSSSAPETKAEHTPPHALWVSQLLEKHGVRALPRTPDELGRAMDSREFWRDFEVMPVRGRWERGRL
ncbi:hypothetical protein JCM8097_008868 [Rhodosporidiobolus ruineniae]